MPEYAIIALILYLAIALMIAGNGRDRDLLPTAFAWPLIVLSAFLKKG